MIRKILLLASLTSFLIVGTRADDHYDPIEKYALENMFGPQDDDFQKPFNRIKSGAAPKDVDAIAEARERYWNTYQTGGPDFLTAKTDLSRLLFLRDVMFLWFDPAATNTPADMATFMGSISMPPGEGIPESARQDFNEWSQYFRSQIHSPGKGETTNISSINQAWDKAQRYFFPPYQIARNWAEESMAPFPIPIEGYVFGLVQRWPYPADFDQAKADYEVLLRTFDEDRVFEAAKKVQSAMGKDGRMENAAAFGVYATGRDALFEMHNPYEVLWMLLAKDDPDLSALLKIYRSRFIRVQRPLSDFSIRNSIFSLQSIVAEWKESKGSPSTDPATLEKQKRAELDAMLNGPLPYYLSPVKTEIEAMYERDAKLPIAQRIQHLDAQIKLLRQRINSGRY